MPQSQSTAQNNHIVIIPLATVAVTWMRTNDVVLGASSNLRGCAGRRRGRQLQQPRPAKCEMRGKRDRYKRGWLGTVGLRVWSGDTSHRYDMLIRSLERWRQSTWRHEVGTATTSWWPVSPVGMQNTSAATAFLTPSMICRTHIMYAYWDKSCPVCYIDRCTIPQMPLANLFTWSSLKIFVNSPWFPVGACLVFYGDRDTCRLLGALQSNSNWAVTLTVKLDTNLYTNPNPIHPIDPTNPTEPYPIIIYMLY